MEKCHKYILQSPAANHADICTTIAKHLNDKTPVHTKIFLLRQLERIGNAESISAIEEGLADKNTKVRDAARRALTNNPSQKAVEIFHRHLSFSTKKTEYIPEDFYIAIVNSLGYRGQPESVPYLAQLLKNKNKKIVAAAMQALAKIKHREADKIIVTAFESNPQDLPTARAYLAVAQRFLASGDKTRAAVRFQKLAETKLQSSIRLAAISGQLQTADVLDRPAHELTEQYLIQKNDPQIQQVAAAHIPKLSEAGIKKLAARCDRFPKSAQLAFLRIIGSTRQRVALEPVLKLCKSNDAEIQIAALDALSGLADEKTVPYLVDTMMAGGKTGEAAARSLEKVFANGVDQRISKMMVGEKDLERRKRFLQILDRRRAITEIDAIVEQCKHADKSVRQLAFNIVSRLASSADISKIIQIHFTNTDRGERDQLEKTVVNICRRIPQRDAQERPVVEIYRSANRESQMKLLPLLGRLGGQQSLKIIRAAVKDKNAKFVDAAVTALANWPSAEVTDDLIRVSTHSNQSLRIRSVRALARVVVLKDSRSDKQRLEMLTKTMKKAERDQERELILDRAKAIRTIETLRFVVPYLDNKKLQQRACRTVVELAHHRGLRKPHQAEFDRALTRVIKITKDKRLADRARNYMKK